MFCWKCLFLNSKTSLYGTLMSSQKGFAEKKELGKGSSYRNMHHVAFWVWWNTSSFATTSSFFWVPIQKPCITPSCTSIIWHFAFGSGNGRLVVCVVGGLGFESHSLSFSGIPKTIQTHQPGTILTDWMVVIRCDLWRLAMPLPLSKRDLVVGDFDWTRMALLGEGVVTFLEPTRWAPDPVD